MAKKKKNTPDTQRTEGAQLVAQTVLDALRREQRPLRLDLLLRILQVPRNEKRRVQELLHELEAQGKLLRVKGGAYIVTEGLKRVRGTLQIQRSGIGFVIPEQAQGADVFVHDSQMGDAWHRDKVEVILLPGRSGPNPEGHITRIIERGASELAVRTQRYFSEDKVWFCQTEDAHIKAAFLVKTDTLPRMPKKDELLLIKPEQKLEQGLWAGIALSLLGNESTVSAQERLVKANHGIPTEFPRPVSKEAESVGTDPDLSDATAMQGRKDMRHMEFVTIDGITAKDFDDAIVVTENTQGWTLFVAIADVAHYVQPGSAMDREALSRSNSYYFPASVEPMLPRQLSNGLCSLNPHVPRFAMVAEIEFDQQGKPGKTNFYSALIESKARLSYDEIQQNLLTNIASEEKIINPIPKHIMPMLETAIALARVLATQREKRGSLDFDLPEAQILVQDDIVANIVQASRHFGHRLIEEFMIAANEAVARFLTQKKIPCVYRVHPTPTAEKLTALFNVVADAGLQITLPPLTALGGTADTQPKEKRKQGTFNKKTAAKAQSAAPKAQISNRDLSFLLQKLLRASEGSPQEYIINRLALRSMMQARYTPELDEHFGLASQAYCHFTSPIRRYADLIVHRSLKYALNTADATFAPDVSVLYSMVETLNSNERAGMEAEREINKRLTALFLHDKIGEEFSGRISGVLEFGFFVELDENMAEGLVSVSSLRDDYYTLIPRRQELRGERTGRSFRLGQAVQVRLTGTNVHNAEVDFELLDSKQKAMPDEAKKPARGSAKKRVTKKNK